ncbi:hypothetical protein HanRHA438_Chr01g0013001 [Helianthus annuus]|nr:hypothetical protein HanRHA438_Chr01g0013001 [Helianthus annuus]
MVPLPGNSKLVQTRYSSCDQDVLASQLASIAASIDSMRKDIAEIRMAWMDENNTEDEPQAPLADLVKDEETEDVPAESKHGTTVPTGDEVIGGGDNREKVEEDWKITVAGSSLMTTKRAELVNFDIQRDLHLEFEIKSNRLDALKTPSIRKSIMFGEKLKDSRGGPGTFRIGQVLESQPNFIVFSNLSKTLRFHVLYLLGRERDLCNTLLGKKKVTDYELFFDILKDRGEKLLRNPFRLLLILPNHRLPPN